MESSLTSSNQTHSNQLATSAGSASESKNNNNSIGSNLVARGNIFRNFSIGNTIVGNGQWIIPGSISQAVFVSEVNNTVDAVVDELFDRLYERLPLEEANHNFGASTPFASENNPFADGRNPFGEGNLPEAPAYDYLTSTFGENYPLPSTEVINSIRGENTLSTTGSQSEDTQPNHGNSVSEIYNPGVVPGSGEDITASSNIPVSNSENNQFTSNNSTADNSNNHSPVINGNGSSEIPSAGGDTNTTNSGSEIPFASGSLNTANSGGGNPFAGGGFGASSGGNPFAGGGFGASSGGNPFAGGGFGASGGGNPFASGGFSASGDSAPIPTGSEFDIVSFLLGDSAPFSNANSNEQSDANSSLTASKTEVLSNVQEQLSSFTRAFNSGIRSNPFGGNTTPLQTPSDLLRLFRTDMYTFNRTVNTFRELLGEDNPFGQDNQFANDPNIGPNAFDVISVGLNGILPFNGNGDNVFTTNENELPIGNGNRDFGTDNAIIGNASWSYGDNNASIGNSNWNWNETKNNATIGNGNWHWDKSENNRTVGNGNWYWDSTNDNHTLGNGNWHFGDNNTTIGNGNWNFGDNNTIIGNGNWVFTDNSIVIGNGNWSVVVDKSATGAASLLERLDTFILSAGVKDTANNLVNTVLDNMGDDFRVLTGGLSETALKTYNELFLT